MIFAKLAKTLRRAVSALLLSLMAWVLPCTASGQTVTFSDPSLEGAIRDALGQPNGVVTRADMESLTALTANSRGITNLSGLEWATNITSLNLDGNSISNLTPLASLKQVTALSMNGNQVQDASPLHGLTGISYLSLRFCPLTNAAQLSALTNLTVLYIGPATLGNVSFVQGLVRMQSLNFYDCQISNLAALTFLTNLTSLEVQLNPAANYSVLSALTNLTYLNLEGGPIGNASFLQGLINLENLVLHNCQLTNLTALAPLTNLRHLGLGLNPLANFSTLPPLTNLVNLRVQGNSISDLTFLQGLIALQYFDFSGNQIGDLLPLQGLTNLQYLNAYGNHLTNITGILNLSLLTHAELRFNFLDISPGSSASNVVHTLVARGVVVEYTPQYTPPLPHLDWKATKYLGTTAEAEVMLNRITPSSAGHLSGIHVDAARTPARYYGFDAANNRILGFYGWRPANVDGSFPPADIVIGQPSGWDHGAVNRDNSQFLQPTAATLALLNYPYVVSTTESPRNGTMATDADGNLYVADLNNNRVLKYNDPFTTDSVADEVWGQADFTTRARPATPSASSVALDTADTSIFGAGVAIDLDGNLWVADAGNHRVLRFPKQGATISKAANLVIGQANFTSKTTGTALNKLYKPQAVRVHPVTGELYVLDGESVDSGFPCRLLVFTPPFNNGMAATRELGKITTDQATGLHTARGFTFDPKDTNGVWVGDGSNHRILKLHTQTGAKLDVIGRSDFTLNEGPAYVRFDGLLNEVRQPEGDMGFDADGNFYFTCPYGTTGIVRLPLPLRRDGAGHVISDGEMLARGWNTFSGRSMQDQYGMAYTGSQLYLGDHHRLLVWNDATNAATFSAADYSIGQETLDKNEAGGTFEGRTVGNMHAAGGRLFVAANSKIFIFATPIAAGGRNTAPLKTISSDTTDLTWADDNIAVPFDCNGLVYDPTNNALWISDYPRNRILRVANPLSATPKVDLVIGQTTKNGSAQNHGLGLYTTDARGIAAPWTLALDNFGNLYAVDSGFEGRDDNAGNLRVLRFDAATIVPVVSNIFPNPAASGVFCKPTLTMDRSGFDPNRPNVPTHISFNSQNQMVLLCDSYWNRQGERAWFYPTPHIGTAPQPTHVLPTVVGQAAFGHFDTADRFILQDHTWNRVIFYDPSATAPSVTITAAPPSVSATTSNVAISGICNTDVIGLLTWKTDAGATGSITAITNWNIPGVPLNTSGPTVISVSGSNAAGTVASAARTVSRESLSAPIILPEAGRRLGPLTVSAHHFRSNVTLRYTLDGSEPTAGSSSYAPPLILTNSGTFKVRAFLSGAPPSQVATASYTLVAATPVITPAGAVFSNSVNVTLATPTTGAWVRFTIDGSEPTEASTLYTGALPLDFSAVIKARAFHPSFSASDTAMATFTRAGSPAATPAIAPAGGPITASTLVTLTTSTPGAQLRYTLDGSDVFSTAPLYTTPFAVNGSIEVKVRAFAAGFTPSAQTSAIFSMRSAWSSNSLPAGTPTRDRHTALGSDGNFLYFTAGNSANAPFHRLQKGGTNWQSQAPLPIPSAVDGGTGVGDLGYHEGSLYTFARHSNESSERAVYRYDITANTWTRSGAIMPGDGVNAACIPLGPDSIFGGWSGWTRIMQITNFLTGAAKDIGDLSGDPSTPWDGCAGATDMWFIKRKWEAAQVGVLAHISRTGAPIIFEIPGFPFNLGMGCAIECIPGKFFADNHERLFILRGGAGNEDGDGGSWINNTTTNQLAIYDVATGAWAIETLPFGVGEGSEMALVDDTLYVLASQNGGALPLRSFRFLGGPPGVSALPASNIATDTATFHATVNARGVATTVFFQYGITTNYDAVTPSQSLAATFEEIPLAAVLTALLPGTIYHYRAVATNSYGATIGPDQTFATQSPATWMLKLLAPQTNGAITLQINGTPGQNYLIQASSDLKRWFNLSTDVLTQNPLTWIDTTTLGVPQRFYRIVPAGTLPTGSMSAVHLLPSNRVAFSYSSFVGEKYVMQASTNLVVWENLSTNTATLNVVGFTNQISPDVPRRFFRVMELP